MSAFRRAVLALCVLFTGVSQLFAADGSLLKPPKHAHVAIQVFEDLECPFCGHAYPMVWDAANSHHIPVVLHDFPLPQHPWARTAAIWARYVDTKSIALGNEFRGYIYKNQEKIDASNLQTWVGDFLKQKKIHMPADPDPSGKLKALIDADVQLGKQVKLQHTPTIFVVSTNPDKPYVEVQDLGKLSQIIEDVQNSLPKPTPTPSRRYRGATIKHRAQPAPTALPGSTP